MVCRLIILPITPPAELVAAIKDPQAAHKIVEQGAEGTSTTPEGLAKFITSESAKWRDIIVKAGIPSIQ